MHDSIQNPGGFTECVGPLAGSPDTKKEHAHISEASWGMGHVSLNKHDNGALEHLGPSCNCLC